MPLSGSGLIRISSSPPSPSKEGSVTLKNLNLSRASLALLENIHKTHCLHKHTRKSNSKTIHKTCTHLTSSLRNTSLWLYKLWTIKSNNLLTCELDFNNQILIFTITSPIKPKPESTVEFKSRNAHNWSWKLYEKWKRRILTSAWYSYFSPDPSSVVSFSATAASHLTANRLHLFSRFQLQETPVLRPQPPPRGRNAVRGWERRVWFLREEAGVNGTEVKGVVHRLLLKAGAIWYRERERIEMKILQGKKKIENLNLYLFREKSCV